MRADDGSGMTVLAMPHTSAHKPLSHTDMRAQAEQLREQCEQELGEPAFIRAYKLLADAGTPDDLSEGSVRGHHLCWYGCVIACCCRFVCCSIRE